MCMCCWYFRKKKAEQTQINTVFLFLTLNISERTIKSASFLFLTLNISERTIKSASAGNLISTRNIKNK
jgi:hypothetical protein